MGKEENKMKDKIMDFEEGQRLLNELDKQCYIDGDYIVLDVRFPYDIELSRCDSPEKILHWVWHLSQKNWVHRHLLWKFINLVCEYHNLEMNDYAC